MAAANRNAPLREIFRRITELAVERERRDERPEVRELPALGADEPGAPLLREGAIMSLPIMLTSRVALEIRGIAALERLLPIAARDTGQAVRVRRFLLGVYNGQAFPFDLTTLRALDRELQEACLAVLAMDIDGPVVEIHCRPGARVIEQWARDAWPDDDHG